MNSYSQSKDLYNIEREESCNYTCLMCNVYYLSAMLRTSFVLQWCTLHCSCVPGFRRQRADALRIDMCEYVSCFEVHFSHWSFKWHVCAVWGSGLHMSLSLAVRPFWFMRRQRRVVQKLTEGVTGLVPAMAAKVSINRRVLEHDNEPGSLTCCKSVWIRASLNPQSVNGAGLPSGISPSLYVPFWWTF